MHESRHIISILLDNSPGVLTRVSGLFSSRGYNILSLTVAPVMQRDISRMTIVTVGQDKMASQIIKQLQKLVDVIDVIDLSLEAHVQHEILMLKIAVTHSNTAKLKKLSDLFNASILVNSNKYYVLEKIDTSEHINEFLRNIKGEFDIIEIARSGTLSIGIGENVLGED